MGSQGDQPVAPTRGGDWTSPLRNHESLPLQERALKAIDGPGNGLIEGDVPRETQVRIMMPPSMKTGSPVVKAQESEAR